MGEALESLAQQSRIIPTMMFRNPQNVSYGMGVEPDIIELGELPHQDEDNFDQFLQKCSAE